MNTDFFKFPSTPHLTLLGGNTIRGDKVLSPPEQSDFLSQEVVVEEKLDGANLGISFDRDGKVRAQNRGSYLRLPAIGQWQPLQEWLDSRVDLLFEILSDRYILFGEWCYAAHSIFYDSLPDWFLGFDVYDIESVRFLDVVDRNELLAQFAIHPVPFIASGNFRLPEVTALLGKSSFGSERSEGIYLRREVNGLEFHRAKIVRPDFVQSINEHWSRKPMRTNRLGYKVATRDRINVQ